MTPDDCVPLGACDEPPTFDAALCDDPAWVLPGTPDAVLADDGVAADALAPACCDPPCPGALDAEPPARCVTMLLAEFAAAAFPPAGFPAG
ncbi:hypothetical protein [Bradyrhizobium sp.]|uniref:hypothetical protein n=1 Tax=Bradyrhizobium sp. TaxID=376 RepID=UPI004037A48F